MADKKTFLNRLYKVIYVTLPVLLLTIIFYKLDLTVFAENLKNTSAAIIFVGILFRPLQILFGSIRWKIITNHYCNSDLSFQYMNQHYWAGLAIGFFTPGGLGWDAYRIITIGKKLKAYKAAFYAVISEKIVGLIAVMGLIVVMFPLVSGYLTKNEALFTNSYLFMVIGLIILLVIILNLHKLKSRRLYSILILFRNHLVKFKGNKKVLEFIRREYNYNIKISYIFNKPKLFLTMLLLSASITCIAAISSQIMFIGLNYEISILVNLFVAPVFFLLFFIPISFGSIGVREGAFILVYGQFGVPMETALLVSFFNLFGLILNSIIGAVIMFIRGIKSNVYAI